MCDTILEFVFIRAGPEGPRQFRKEKSKLLKFRTRPCHDWHQV
jgi:hypothetical protein